MVDISNVLHIIAADSIKRYVSSVYNFPMEKLTFCSSPLFLDGTNSCLPARLVRELGAKYGMSDNMVIATNALEGSNCTEKHICMCMKHITVSEDLTPGYPKEGSGTAKKPKEKVKKEPKKKEESLSGFMNAPEEDKGQVTEVTIPKRKPVKKTPKLPKGVLTRY